MLDDAGIKLAVLDTGFFKVPLPEAGSADGAKALGKQWDLLDRAFERANVLGTKMIRTFAFTYKRDEVPSPDAYPRIYDFVGRSYVATAAQSAALLKAVGSPGLGLTWDPNNSAQSGDPEPFPAGYQSLDASRIWHVHLRDYRRAADGSVEWCGVGDGEFDHAGQIRASLADGYQGVFSLETHYTINGSKAAASERSLKGLFRAAEQV